MNKKVFALFVCVILLATALFGCTPVVQHVTATAAPVETVKLAPVQETQAQPVTKIPKYVFLFIGDGMSHVQINATQIYLGNNKAGEIAEGKLNFSQFPVTGLATTYDATSFCPDSASTGTALSCGIKTHSGVVGLAADKTTKPQNITEILKSKGYKIGIVSNVSIDHATPAAFYAHIDARSKYYDIALQLSQTEIDYFGGGALLEPTGKEKDKKDVYEIIKSEGYNIVYNNETIKALNNTSGKVYAVSPVLQDSRAMPYSMDTKEGELTLADFVAKGIDVLDNDKGFFMMCESGKIDWACHANDAMSAINDVIGLDKSIKVAMDFAMQHPDETLILVTGDHETGGMTIGYAATGYTTAFDILSKQKISYVAFDTLMKAKKAENPALTLSELLPIIKENFGLIAPGDPEAAVEANKPLVLTEFEFKKLQDGFAESMKPKDQRVADEQAVLLYGGYDPLSVTITHIINNKAGIGWTSYAHTGTPVPVYAMGAGAQTFAGSYDDTDIFKKMVQVLGL